MFGKSFLYDEFKNCCRLMHGFKCEGSSSEPAELSGAGDDFDEAEQEVSAMMTDFCTRAAQKDPIFRIIDCRCSCDRE